MPVYDYDCPHCGPFEELRPMAEFDRPQSCPVCGEAAPRVMLSAPGLALMEAGRRHAFATNEKSAHAPSRSHGHGANCGCAAHGGRKRQGAAAKSFPGTRPWMISH